MPARGRPPLSQHFLEDPATAARIADALGARAGASVLEIGPGRGALTRHLLDRGWRVTAVELDADLARSLEERWGERPELTIVVGDALEHVVPAGSGPWWVIGNLPYAITSPLLFHFLAQVESAPIEEMVLMVQKEVAERLAATPGTKAWGALTVGVRLAADVERLFDVGPGRFRPRPKVVSSVVRLVPHDRWELGEAGRGRIRSLVRSFFSRRRKQIQKTLRTDPALGLDPAVVARIAEATGIDLDRRPETLSLDEWLSLERAVRREARNEGVSGT